MQLCLQQPSLHFQAHRTTAAHACSVITWASELNAGAVYLSQGWLLLMLRSTSATVPLTQLCKCAKGCPLASTLCVRLEPRGRHACCASLTACDRSGAGTSASGLAAAAA